MRVSKDKGREGDEVKRRARGSCAFVFRDRDRGRVQTTDVTVVPQENYRDRARGRDSCR